MVVTALEVDGLRPARVDQPQGEEEVAETLRAAAAAGQSVVPVGGGRALGLGRPLDGYDVAIETRGLNRVLEISQADMTVSVQAGITIEELNEELGRAGQVLPVDPFNSPGHTVGGVLAAGLSGPLRLRFGSARDFTIGLRVALPDGRLASSGGRVVKNVSGYDMTKLHQGALGSLGVVVAASFKVFPRPLFDATVGTRADDGWVEAERALGLAQRPVALELSSDGRLLARFWGTGDGVRRMCRELGWAEVDPAAWSEHSRLSGARWARISVPPARLAGAVGGLPAGATWWASPGVGVAHWIGDTVDASSLAEARAAAEAAGGSLVLMNGPVDLKREVDAWGTPPASLPWMVRMRDAFDPQRTIARGRYVV